MDDIATQISRDLPEPVVLLGMAETATALGHGVFAAYRRDNPSVSAIYLQTSRQRVESAQVMASFEEGHSHATTHLVQVRAETAAIAASARTLIMVDDECSTGGTFLACADAMRSAMPKLERIETCCITDWSDGAYLPGMPLETTAHSVLEGRMDWTPTDGIERTVLAAASNRPGTAPDTGMRSRTGILEPEAARRSYLAEMPDERVLVLGDGEHSYEALLVAEDLEAAGAVAAVQCMTRSPALLGYAMGSVSELRDSYGSGAPCYVYNLLEHRPDRVVIVAEALGTQSDDVLTALAKLGSDIPVSLVQCRYDAAI